MWQLLPVPVLPVVVVVAAVVIVVAAVVVVYPGIFNL